MEYQRKVKLNRGFTLVELIIVLSLLLVILAAVFNFFDFTQRVYVKTETQNILQDEVNKVIKYLSDDIRSAAKPDDSTKPILVFKDGSPAEAGNRIDIYDYKDGAFYKTSYIFADNALKRGVVNKSTADSIKSASVTYEIILEGVQYPLAEELFTDLTVETAGEVVDRRHIEIKLLVKDPHDNISNVYTYELSYTSRTKGAPK